MDADLLQGRIVPGKPVPFQAHVELLRLFLTHREEIVERIGTVLNAQRKPRPYLQDRSLLSRHFEDCFFQHTAVTTSQARLRGQLEEAYCSTGFLPRPLAGMHNDLIHPAEMMVRGFHLWQQTHWPGRNGRTRYAHTLFNVYLIRCLELLSLRLWDEDPANAGGRLREMQDVLDELWNSSPADQPRLLRDARWLIPLAQSLPTDDLAVYLEVARLVAETLPEADSLEIQKAHVRMLGGHLTSQIRHLCMKEGVLINDHSVVLRTRTSNALDFALLIQGLVPLLKAYASAGADERLRFEMAGAIFQGISADPELFLNRVDLVSAYSMMERVFIAVNGPIAYSSLGERHVQLLKEYRTLIDGCASSLRDDLSRFRPVEGGCSPYGVVFGYPSTLTELMALKALERDAETRFSLEDVFEDGDTGAAKLAWVNGWRKLPHVPLEVQRVYEYPQQFAEDIYNRIDHELSRESCGGSETGRLYILPEDEPETDASAIPDLPARYFGSSDSHQTREGHYLVSYETPAGWIALKKDLLTEVLGAGRDARIAGLPPEAAQVLRLICGPLQSTKLSKRGDR
jgi:hypothetical protein